MGKASFAHILDGEGDIQVYLKRDDIGEEQYKEFKQYDIGDIIGVTGFVFKTQTGETTVHRSEDTRLKRRFTLIRLSFSANRCGLSQRSIMA